MKGISMEKEVKEFLEKNKKHGSKLNKYEKEIMQMRDAGATYLLIRKYLGEKGITTSISNLQKWIMQKKETKK